MVDEAGPEADGRPVAPPDPAAPPPDFYDAAEWTDVLVGIGERFRSRVDGKVLQAMLTEMLAAHTEFAAAATADRMRFEAALAALPGGGRLDDKLTGLQSAVGDLEASYTTLGHDDRVAEVAQATLAAAEKESSELLAEARAEAELVREQAVTMAESMIAAAADEADQRRRVHDEEIAEGRIEMEAEAVKILEDALADADFIRTSAEEAGARALADADVGAEALRRAVVEEIAALRAAAEEEIAALRVSAGAGDDHDDADGTDRETMAAETARTRAAAETTAAEIRAAAEEDAAARRREAEADASRIKEAAEAEAETIRSAAADEAERIRVEAVLAAKARRDGAELPSPPDAAAEAQVDTATHTVDPETASDVATEPTAAEAPPRPRRRGFYRRRRVGDVDAHIVADADIASDPQAEEAVETDAPDGETADPEPPTAPPRRRRRGGAGS